MPIFDTHAHYDDSRFDGDRDAVLAALPEAGVELVLDPGCDLPSSRAAAALAERYSHVYAAAGIHPENCAGFQDADLAALRQLLAQPKVAAIGEIGLDYYWAENPPRDFQQMVFRKQLALAEELLKRGWYLGFDGPITYKNARRAPEVAAITPLERMVVETDAPYLSPVPVRGRRNDSRYLPHIIAKLAEWKGVTPEEMTRITCENGKRLFRLG